MQASVEWKSCFAWTLAEIIAFGGWFKPKIHRLGEVSVA